MPSIKDDSTVDRIAEVFCGNGRNKTEALRTVGYKDSYCDYHGTTVVYSNSRVKQAIAKIDAKTQAKNEHDRQIAIDLLLADYKNLAPAAGKGNIAAVNARTAIVRELDCITGLQQQVNINRNSDTKPQLKPEEQARLNIIANEYMKRKA